MGVFGCSELELEPASFDVIFQRLLPTTPSNDFFSRASSSVCVRSRVDFKRVSSKASQSHRGAQVSLRAPEIKSNRRTPARQSQAQAQAQVLILILILIANQSSVIPSSSIKRQVSKRVDTSSRTNGLQSTHSTVNQVVAFAIKVEISRVLEQRVREQR